MPDYWGDYIVPDFDFAAFEPGATVLDVGCGPGDQLAALRERGVVAAGLDVLRRDLIACRERGLAVFEAVAERMPLRDGALDGIVCKVVVPLTDESAVLAESSRLMRADAKALFCYHGVGYYLRYLLGADSPSWRQRAYALRTILNTWFYALFGRRLPGFVGDTLYQSKRRLRSYYRRFGLRLERETPSPTFMGFPVFVYHDIRKV